MIPPDTAQLEAPYQREYAKGLGICVGLTISVLSVQNTTALPKDPSTCKLSTDMTKAKLRWESEC